MKIYLSVLFVCVAVVAVHTKKVNPKDLNVTTFGTAIKNGHLTYVKFVVLILLSVNETVIFQHSSSTGGVITEMWMTGGCICSPVCFFHVA